MRRALIMGYALVSYLLFLGVFLWFVGFLADVPFVPTTVERGIAAPAGKALAIDLGLIALFGFQHTFMARAGFKRAWTRVVTPPAERATYVLIASLTLGLMMLAWHPIEGAIWDLRAASVAPVLWAAFGIGWVVLLTSTFLLNHFELFGLQQAWQGGDDGKFQAPQMRVPLFYKVVRHPLYLGFVIALWATPYMSYGHLVVAAGLTVYILIGIMHEERDLVALFGRDYEDYRSRVGMLIPGLGRRGSPAA